MLDFKRLTLDDLPFIRQHLIQSTGRFCDETPGTLFMWRNYYSVAYAECAGSIILRYQSGLPASAGAFSLISGQYSRECISAICDYCREHRFPAILSTVPEDGKDWLKEHYPVKSEQHDDDWADYLYDAETMIALLGSSFGGQRNHIHQFERKYPDAEIKTISPENMEDAADALEAVIDRLCVEGPSPEELERGRAEAASFIRRRMQDIGGRAFETARQVLRGRGLDFERRWLEGLRAVTAEDVRDVSSRYLVLEEAAELCIMPEDAMEE